MHLPHGFLLLVLASLGQQVFNINLKDILPILWKFGNFKDQSCHMRYRMLFWQRGLLGSLCSPSLLLNRLSINNCAIRAIRGLWLGFSKELAINQRLQVWITYVLTNFEILVINYQTVLFWLEFGSFRLGLCKLLPGFIGSTSFWRSYHVFTPLHTKNNISLSHKNTLTGSSGFFWALLALFFRLLLICPPVPSLHVI